MARQKGFDKVAGATDGPTVRIWTDILNRCPYDDLDSRYYTYRFLCRVAIQHAKVIDGFIGIESHELQAIYEPTASYRNNCLSCVLDAIKLLNHASTADALRNHAADNRKFKRRKR